MPKCEEGSFAKAGATLCAACGAGTFAGIGATACQPCLAGRASQATKAKECALCSVGAYSQAGATSCKCKQAYYNTSRFTAACVPGGELRYALAKPQLATALAYIQEHSKNKNSKAFCASLGAVTECASLVRGRVVVRPGYGVSDTAARRLAASAARRRLRAALDGDSDGDGQLLMAVYKCPGGDGDDQPCLGSANTSSGGAPRCRLGHQGPLCKWQAFVHSCARVRVRGPGDPRR